MKAYMILENLELDELKTWDQKTSEKYGPRMLAIAKEVAGWSKCPKGKRHGCVLAFKGKYIASTGYNGPAAGYPHCFIGDCYNGPAREDSTVECAWDDGPNGPNKCPAIHAEVNAVVNMARLGMSSYQCTAYVTKTPCKECLAVLRNAGVEIVVVEEV